VAGQTANAIHYTRTPNARASLPSWNFVSATGRNGVLEVSIRKHPKAQPKRIAVK